MISNYIVTTLAQKQLVFPYGGYFLALMLMVSPQLSFSELVSISSHPTSRTEQFEVSKLLSEDRNYNGIRHTFDPNDGGLLSKFRLFNNFSYPLVCWARPGIDCATEVTISEGTWGELLDSFKASCGQYRIIKQGSFVELVWGHGESALLEKTGDDCRVSPILFLAEDKKEFLTIWNEVSGVEFLYETDLILEPSRTMNWRASFPTFFSELRTDPPNLSQEFLVSNEESLQTFMSILAAEFGGSAWKEGDNWVIGSFRQNGDSLEIVRSLLDELRSMPAYGDWAEIIKHLQPFGESILPLVRADLIKAKRSNDFCYISRIVDLLLELDSTERDKVLLDLLSQLMVSEDILEATYEGHNVTLEDRCKYDIRISTADVVDELAENQFISALPLIEEMASRESPVPSFLKFALNHFGKPPSPGDPTVFLTVAETANEAWSSSDLSEDRQIFLAALDQWILEWSEYPELEVVEIRSNVDGNTAFVGTYGHINKQWTIIVKKGQHDKATVFYKSPNSASEGYARKVGRRWLFLDAGTFFGS